MEKLVTDEAELIARSELQKAIAPVVKEAITEDVLGAVRDMIGLLPDAIAAIKEDIGSDDPDIRQRAYTLLVKHTAGSRNLVPDVNEAKQRDLTVVFGIPRPDGTGEARSDGTTGVIESKACDSCHVVKPADSEHFVQGTDRCRECFDSMRASAMSLVVEGGIRGDD